MRTAAAEGRSLLTEPEAKAVLSAYGIPPWQRGWPTAGRDVERIAATLLERTGSVAVKILSDDIPHKSDVGGVRLGLRSPQDARHAAQRMRQRVPSFAPMRASRASPCSRRSRAPTAHELLIGVYEDRLFGPMILFGAGGTATEIIRDTAVALPPLDLELARDLMEQTRIFRLLEGYRDPASCRFRRQSPTSWCACRNWWWIVRR